MFHHENYQPLIHLPREVVKFPGELDPAEILLDRVLGQAALQIAAWVASCSRNAALGAVVQPGEEQLSRS